MANEQTRQSLQILAARIKKSQLDLNEQVSLNVILETRQLASRGDIRKLLAEALKRSENEVLVALSSHNDSDRIIDDIITNLKKSP